jgi:alpha-tubulin suppressor-like RCC1 family protein
LFLLWQESGDFSKFSSFIGSPLRSEKGHLAGSAPIVETKNVFDTSSVVGSMHSGSSSLGSDSVSGHGRLVGTGQSDNYRISMSSAVSSSSQSSLHGEDSSHLGGEGLGDVYIWGEGAGDGILGGGVHRIGSGGGNKLDALLPKPLESAMVLDVQFIACGGKHAALVTKQGEVFTWGEESGGRLGHGVDCDVSHPQLVEALASSNTEVVACGEYHACAVTLSGDLYTWGDGTHSLGLLGHGNDISHWIPKRVNGPLEGIRVASIACGPWHTALVTTSGQLFTFGDGTFGVLGHNDRKSSYSPREVESLKGLKTVKAACGVWHTAAVVEVMVGNSSASSCSSGKLFTWGDGDKGRLGHGDKEQRLVPTCVAALVDHNFRQVGCGYSLTVALTTSGQVFTMGGSTYGQLGDPQADGKLPGVVEGKLCEAYVEEISCGAHHVAVLTHKSEVYTWGKGANGRLGHGDVEDRNTPTLVEALKDKQVKSIACGATFTAAICLHKWLSGADQNACTGCRQPFGFTRKRHNCYNCGLVFCHACSSKKALKAALAPNPGKPYRVCDPCFNKLRKAGENGGPVGGTLSKRGGPSRRAMDLKDGSSKGELRVPRPQGSGSGSGKPPNSITLEFGKSGDAKSGQKRTKKPDSSSSRVSPAPNGSSGVATWGSVSVPAGFLKPPSTPSLKGPGAISSSMMTGRAISRAVSPLSRRSSPPRSTTPTPTGTGLVIPRTVVEDLKKTNDTLSDENVQLRSQVTVVLVSLFLWYFTFTVALHVDLCGKCPVTVYHVVEFHMIVWAFSLLC